MRSMRLRRAEQADHECDDRAHQGETESVGQVVGQRAECNEIGSDSDQRHANRDHPGDDDRPGPGHGVGSEGAKGFRDRFAA
jgi:hypothetical protein